MLGNLREQVTQILSHVELRVAAPEEPEPALPARPAQKTLETRRDPALVGGGALTPAGDRELEPVGAGGRAPAPEEAESARRPGAGGSTIRHAKFDANDPATWTKIGRNAPCPCGSGRKYKHCHGKLA